RIAFVGDEHDGAGLSDRDVRAADADGCGDELLAQGFTETFLDRGDVRLAADHASRVLFREVDGRRDQVRRVGVGQLDHSLAKVGLDDLESELLQVWVELDLLGRHRFDLGHDRPAATTFTGARRVPADVPDY